MAERCAAAINCSMLIAFVFCLWIRPIAGCNGTQADSPSWLPLPNY